MGTGAARDDYALRYGSRAVNAPKIAAVVIRHFGRTEALVAVVGAIRNPPIVLPIANTVLTADIDTMIARLKDHVIGSNLGPDHVVKQAVVEEISLKGSHAREILLIPFSKRARRSSSVMGCQLSAMDAIPPHLNDPISKLSCRGRSSSQAAPHQIRLTICLAPRPQMRPTAARKRIRQKRPGHP
jgi:hypothetical protein